jgi:hypothetical protein
MLFFQRMTPNSMGGSLRTSSTVSFSKFGTLFSFFVIYNTNFKKYRIDPILNKVWQVAIADDINKPSLLSQACEGDHLQSVGKSSHRLLIKWVQTNALKNSTDKQH